MAGVNERRRHGQRNKVTALHEILTAPRIPLVTEARNLLDPDLEQIMEAVYRNDSSVRQVIGDGIMAFFGARYRP